MSTLQRGTAGCGPTEKPQYTIWCDLLKRLSEIIRYTTVCLIQQMKWLAQLKIQERGRAVALKEAAAVQQPEIKKSTKKRTHHLYTRTRVPHIDHLSKARPCVILNSSGKLVNKGVLNELSRGFSELCNAYPIHCNRSQQRTFQSFSTCGPVWLIYLLSAWSNASFQDNGQRRDFYSRVMWETEVKGQ